MFEIVHFVDLITSLIAVIFSIFAVVWMIILARRMDRETRKILILITIGILLSVTIHSFIGFLTIFDLMANDFSFFLMNFLLIIGSFFFLVSGMLTIPQFWRPSASKSISILHIDDDENILEITKKYCERQQKNFSFTSIVNSTKALELLSSNSFDIVVCDYDLPEFNGLQILESIRKNKNDIPFIMFTGKGREDVAMKALNLGANYYLMKGDQSFTTQYRELIHIINQITSYHRTHETLRKTQQQFDQIAPLILEKSPKAIWRDYREIFIVLILVFTLAVFDFILDYFIHFKTGSFQDYVLDYLSFRSTFIEHLAFIFFGLFIGFFWWKYGKHVKTTRMNVIKLTNENKIILTQNKELNEFILEMSHDLKGNLHIISNFANLYDEKNSKISKKIQENVYQIDRLFTRSMELAQLGIPIRKDSRIQLNELVQEALKFSIAMNVKVSVTELLTVNCDHQKVIQIFSQHL